MGLTSIFYKIDGYTSWEWKETFWWYWILLSLLIGINLGIFILLTSKILSYCSDKDFETKVEIVGMGWIFSLALFGCLGSYIWVSATLNILEDDK